LNQIGFILQNMLLNAKYAFEKQKREKKGSEK
jgi:hypothetical protein